jgi:hypothetical protein
MATRDELLAAIRSRYGEASRAEKARILDELVAVSGYHRKHAIRLVGSGPKPRRTPRPARRRYGEAAREALAGQRTHMVPQPGQPYPQRRLGRRSKGRVRAVRTCIALSLTRLGFLCDHGDSLAIRSAQPSFDRAIPLGKPVHVRPMQLAEQSRSLGARSGPKGIG